jgi:hypothetical protein
MLVGALAAMLFLGGAAIVRGAKKAGHAIAHAITHGVHPKK